MSNLNATFKEFATKANGAEMTSKDVTRWFKDAKVFGTNCSSNNLDIAFSKVKPKGKPNITVKELGPLIDEVAKAYAKDKKIEVDAAKEALKDKLSSSTKQAHGVTKTSKTGNVGKMTDASQYTGAHKERFDADGKGKGIDGREERHENTGYVGGYKDKDTYDSKTKGK